MSIYQNQYCFLAGNDGRIFKSEDFGENWDSVGYIVPTGQSQLYCCGFANQFTGWAGGSYGVLYKTTNGGASWRAENTNNYAGYNSSIYFYDTLIGWVAGSGGKILYTISGGAPLIHISNNNEPIINDFELFQNYPNPFNPVTNIKFQIPKDRFVSLKVYDITGREITKLVNEVKQAGSYTVTFNGSNFASGFYFYRIQAGNFVLVKRMVLIK